MTGRIGPKPQAASGATDISALARLAGTAPKQIRAWQKAKILSAPADGQAFSDNDVAVTAVLVALQHQRLTDAELTEVDRLLYQGCRKFSSLGIDRHQLPTILLHANLRLTDEQGQFETLVESGAAPILRLFSGYSDYVEELAVRQQLPAQHILDIAEQLDEDDLMVLQYYGELSDPSYLTTTAVAPFWDIVLDYDVVRILSRTDGTTVPWDIADSSDLAAFITISPPVLSRQIAARRFVENGR